MSVFTAVMTFKSGSGGMTTIPTSVLACIYDKGWDFMAIYMGGMAGPMAYDLYTQCADSLAAYSMDCPYSQLDFYNIIMNTIKDEVQGVFWNSWGCTT